MATCSGCAAGCGSGCAPDCTGGCTGSCSSECVTTCSATCADTCGSGCAPSACGSNCSSDCTTSCSGTCKGTCSGTCSGSCGNGCGDACSNTCANNCGNSCDTACNATCNGAAQDTNFAALTLSKEYKQEDIQRISDFIINEAKRRGKSTTALSFSTKEKIDASKVNIIVTNLETTGYSVSSVNANDKALRSWAESLIAEAKKAYNEVVPIS